jgi:hypothetical protein
MYKTVTGDEIVEIVRVWLSYTGSRLYLCDVRGRGMCWIHQSKIIGL